MEAIILAGGMGTRLKSVVSDVPKPMADIGGRPFLACLLGNLARFSIRRVVLSVGYKHEIIRDYFGDKFRGITVEYAVEQEPLGTGGAIVAALAKLDAPDVLILNGDTFFNMDLTEIFNHHVSSCADVTMALKKMHDFDRYGTVVVDGNRIVGFEEKAPRASGYINAGVYVLRHDVFRYKSFGYRFSFETDFLTAETGSIALAPFISDGYFIDIGIPEDYQKAQTELPHVLLEA